MNKTLENVIERKIGSSAQESLHLVNLNINLFLEDMLRSSVDIATNPSITKLLKEPQSYSPYEKLRLNDTVLNRRLYSSYFTNTYTTLFDREGNWLSTSFLPEQLREQYVGAKWYQDMMSKPYQQKWMFNNNERLYLDRKPIVTIVKTITELQSARNIGMIVFSVTETDLRRYLSGLTGEVYLADQEGTIVSSLTESMVGQNLSDEGYMNIVQASDHGQQIIKMDGDKWIVNYGTISINGWKLVQLVPYDTVFKEIFDTRYTNWVVFVLILIVFLLITLSVSYRISRPLLLLRKRMQELEEKGFHSTLSVSGPEEIASLIETYNRMVKEIRGLLTRVKDEYKQKEDMRFRALQAQINPHFLLNTINNIKWMAYLRQDGEVGDMLSNLGGILEGSIGRGGSLIPLRQELDYIDNYVGLMRMKFHDIELVIQVPEELMEQEVIQIMLQPVVENSLIHGIEPLGAAGRITVEARVENATFVLDITDNGVGMSNERLAEIRAGLEAEADADKEAPMRIGIKNVHDRLRLQYGEEYGIRIYSEAGRGTTVRYVLPVRFASKEGAT
ncbi:sensor histidine kinase [Paenibacillus xylaniclasticus]|uniref:sensor histidine kinase n=1 Tax=Paenibacillus xylaniclasticus TaxID=588083 RepID=UPI0017548845|nr:MULTISPECIES: sensor histidine kinase [Paenibacillus]GFN30026.1 sensor histidine kinase YesM [Paenibacillus curdlanolyticus]